MSTEIDPLRRRALAALLLALVGGISGCNPIDLAELLVRARKPDTLLSISAQKDLTIEFKKPLVEVAEIEKFGLVPDAKLGTGPDQQWYYNIFASKGGKFLFSIRVECPGGKITRIHCPATAADLLPRDNLMEFVEILANSDFDLSKGVSHPKPLGREPLDFSFHRATLDRLLGPPTTLAQEGNRLESQHFLRLGKGRDAADVLVRATFRKIPERLVEFRLFVRNLSIEAHAGAAQMTLYSAPYRHPALRTSQALSRPAAD
jgi:hypothetical protein